MPKAPKMIWIAFAFALLAVTPARATDKDFQEFWSKFKLALQKNDKAAIVSMTKCPFFFDSKQLNKAELPRQIDRIIPLKVRHCVITQHPVFDKNYYSVICGERIYSFTKVDGHYMLTDLDAND